MKLMNKRIISLLLALVVLCGMMPGLTINAFAAEQTTTNEFEGKTISILGASMSTYTGISNNPDYNSTIGNNAVYYTEGKLGVYKNDTWWMQVANDLGLELLVNNSWSGSSLLHERNGTVGAYVDRCVQLHNNEGEMPDIIAIQMGTNDFQYYKDTLGTADIDYAELIVLNEDGSYTYAEPTTSLEAAAIVLHKISIRYPNAEVYYLNISQRIDGTDELIRSFNAELKQVVELFGAHIVDVYGSAITMADFDTYIGDGRVHPNCLGMDAYTEAFKRALLANTAYDVDTHTVSLNLDGVTADYGDDKIVVSGDAFSCTLTAEDGKELSVSVTMGGEDITDTAYENGTVSIESVTDDVTITAEATVHKSQNYRWEFDGTDLSCVSGGNTLTKDSGTTTDGVFSKTSYTLENEVVLMHDLPWIVEWKCEGTFLNTNGSSGARVFTSDNVNANYNARYIFKSNTNGIIAMGEKTTSGSHNYGIALGDYGIDWTALHTYRLENRIADDGSNMIWLLVDGEEIGPMNHYYIGTKDQTTTSDWVSSEDFVFPYMGTDTHGFTNASIEYIQVSECDHTYENGICTGCGEIVVDGIWQIMEDGVVIGAYSDLQCAVDACKDDSTIVLTEGYAATTGASIDKNITIDGDNHLVDISGCSDAFITVVEGAEVTVRDLRMDSGANGFAVDYDAVTYTDYTIPLVSGSLDSDPKVSKSAIISSGSLICENVEISNRYTASVGGAMQILAGTATLTNCDFTHNYGTSKGGALFIGSNFGTRTEYPVELVTITGCTFTENYTGHGGAIYAYNVAAIEITDSEFLNNTANGGKGGAIDLFSETTKPTTAMSLGLDFIQTSICNCTFRGNWAGNDGFAIQSYDSDLYIYDSEFIENVGVHPTSSVGTVSIEAYRHADENYRIYTQMDGCLFESNQGPCAVYGDHSSISDLDVTDCVFQYNKGNTSFLLYSATSRISNCQFIGEVMVNGVIDARIYENYTIPPLLTLADITFTGCDTPAEILTRKQGHNAELNTYRVILEGTTNGNITIWDSNTVTVNGTHTGNVQFGYGSERACLTVGSSGTVNGIIFAQPVDSKAKLGERYMVEVKAEGEGLKYQWYFRNAGSSKWNKSSVKDNTYDDVMTAARAGREVYCVITDANGNSVTTDIVKLICLPSVTLEIVTQPVNDEAVLGEDFCVTVEAKGDGLKYQWYFRNAGSDKWYKASVKDNTYDDVMTKARADREIYCVITDAYGNKVTTDIAKLIRIPKEELQLVTQPTDATAAFDEMFCATVEATGEGLKYQWYYRNAGSDTWHKSGVRDNTYDDVMTKARNGREIYCVITDEWGNTVTTDIVKLIAVPTVELKLLGQSYESVAMGERFCVTVEAEGEGLTYTWYFRNAGATKWYKSGVKDNTYDDVMNKTRAGREVYCVIADAFGSQIITEAVTLTAEK